MISKIQKGQEKYTTYIRMGLIQAQIDKETVVGTFISFWDIGDMHDIQDGWDTKVQMHNVFKSILMYVPVAVLESKETKNHQYPKNLKTIRSLHNGHWVVYLYIFPHNFETNWDSPMLHNVSLYRFHYTEVIGSTLSFCFMICGPIDTSPMLHSVQYRKVLLSIGHWVVIQRSVSPLRPPPCYSVIIDRFRYTEVIG